MAKNMSLTSEKLHKQTLKEQRIVFRLSSQTLYRLVLKADLTISLLLQRIGAALAERGPQSASVCAGAGALRWPTVPFSSADLSCSGGPTPLITHSFNTK